MKDHFVETNFIQLHYIDYGGDGVPLILFHGLTANAHAFDGLISEGLNTNHRVLSVDLRGRGQSEAPPQDYSMQAHAADILGLLDALQITSAIIGGHSFGALLSLYLASHYPDRVKKLVLLDAAAKMHADTKQMLVPAMSRLGQTFSSFDAYIEKVKAAPYMNFWDEEMLSYFQADVKKLEEGKVTPIPQMDNMMQAVNGALNEPWLDLIPKITQPALLINGPGIYTLDAALLPEENAKETVGMMKNCTYVKVPGNHQTMLYGDGAKEIVKAIRHFLNTPE